MQNKYVGDIGDFGKNGLLRHLTGMREDAKPKDALRSGVVWYLFPDEKSKKPGSGDGRLTGYLCDKRDNHKKFRNCDTNLYDELHNIVYKEKKREVLRIQTSGMLPKDTYYYAHSLSYLPRESETSKKTRREAWLKGALDATREAKLVFVDPDNGIAIADKGEANQATGITKVDLYSKRGPKYVFMDDLERFYKRGQSLVIYHHMGRQGTATEQINRLAERLKECLKLPYLPRALRYRRGTTRFYFIVPHERHRDELEKLVQEFKRNSCWFEPQTGFKHPHFKLVKPTEG